ncbi:outer membrane lipoprotein carrier protein LolA [Sphingomonas sp. LaA6.9]|uniref:LolA family protein n=1 Tax=Sphingomonas sp. LaA6.9 TaxID=2919914 RepID=UPI001F4F79E3|nr:outer membrane lipoprotein carrier protein LolA [Sphingomonas sp. LaA6.9]MCJ8159612.1 outer membrane lipoprotein carrier protein LolA [Sphingomonas sp. LaA6.9]
MFRRLALALTTIPLGVGTLTAPAVIAAPGDLDKVSAHLRSVSSMTAGFSQTDRAGKTVAGTLTMKRPGKMSFQYQKGVPLRIVADGKSLWMIDYQVNQVQRWPIGKSPLAVLLDPNPDLSRIARIVPNTDDRIVVVEARDPKRPEYGTLTLAFVRNASAPGGLMLQGWVALDSQNNRTTIRLNNQKFNVAVADNAFHWNDPRPKGPRG